jgi:hypothetical protein
VDLADPDLQPARECLDDALRMIEVAVPVAPRAADDRVGA